MRAATSSLRALPSCCRWPLPCSCCQWAGLRSQHCCAARTLACARGTCALDPLCWASMPPHARGQLPSGCAVSSSCWGRPTGCCCGCRGTCQPSMAARPARRARRSWSPSCQTRGQRWQLGPPSMLPSCSLPGACLAWPAASVQHSQPAGSSQDWACSELRVSQHAAVLRQRHCCSLGQGCGAHQARGASAWHPSHTDESHAARWPTLRVCCSDPLDFREDSIPASRPAEAPAAGKPAAPAGAGALGTLMHSFQDELGDLAEGWTYICSSANRRRPGLPCWWRCVCCCSLPQKHSMAMAKMSALSHSLAAGPELPGPRDVHVQGLFLSFRPVQHPP